MAKRGRKATHITKSEMIKEYWDKHKDELEKLYPAMNTRRGHMSSEDVFKSKMKYGLDNFSWHSKKKAKQDIEDLIVKQTQGKMAGELREAKRDASDRPREFKDLRKLNGKINPNGFVDCNIDNGTSYNPLTHATMHETIVGYWEISDSNYILCKVVATIDDDSPVEYYKYIDRTVIGV